MTHVTYIGNATSDAELRFTQSGTAVANINLAVNTRSKKGDEYVDDPTLFIRVTVWQDQAENIAESIEKGSRVFVQGRQKMTEFTTREGETRQQLEVTADEIGPTLRWAVAKPNKVNRRQRSQESGAGWTDQQGGPPQGDPWQGGATRGGNDSDPPF